MLMHQGMGLDAFNALPMQRAVHALYECCYSVPFASELAQGRPYADHGALFRRADELLFTLPEECIDTLLQACPHVGQRPRSAKSRSEQCAVWDDCPDVQAELHDAGQRYSEQFGFPFVLFVTDHTAPDVLKAITDRMHNDTETERKVLRNELAKINRTRLERMLGPEGGYQNWW